MASIFLTHLTHRNKDPIESFDSQEVTNLLQKQVWTYIVNETFLYTHTHTHTETNALKYKQAMKTGKHEDKAQVLGQFLTIGNLLRSDYKKASSWWH